MLNNTKPVRNIRPSHRSITGKFASKKTGSTHYFESALERDYLTLLEFDSKVNRFLTQPLTVNFFIAGQSRRYTPDVLVHFNEELNKKPLLCEVKYREELEIKCMELRPKFDAASQYAKECNLEFTVVTEKEIRTPYLYNLKFLSRYHDAVIEQDRSDMILRVFENSNGITAGSLLLGNPDGGLLQTLWQMISAQILMCDLNEKITMTTKIWINNRQIANYCK